MFKVLRNRLVRHIRCCPNLWCNSDSKWYRMDSFDAYFTCSNLYCVQNATEWTAYACTCPNLGSSRRFQVLLVVVGFDMCEACTRVHIPHHFEHKLHYGVDMCSMHLSLHSALWTRLSLQVWTCVKKCIEAIHFFSLWVEVTQQVWTCVSVYGSSHSGANGLHYRFDMCKVYTVHIP